jgi:hypothetical protein
VALKQQGKLNINLSRTKNRRRIAAVEDFILENTSAKVLISGLAHLRTSKSSQPAKISASTWLMMIPHL